MTPNKAERVTNPLKSALVRRHSKETRNSGRASYERAKTEKHLRGQFGMAVGLKVIKIAG